MAGKKRAPRQEELPGVEDAKNDPEVNSALESYHAAKKKRVNALVKEKSTKAALIQILKAKGIASYKDRTAVPHVSVTLTPGSDKLETSEVEVEDATGED